MTTLKFKILHLQQSSLRLCNTNLVENILIYNVTVDRVSLLDIVKTENGVRRRNFHHKKLLTVIRFKELIEGINKGSSSCTSGYRKVSLRHRPRRPLESVEV
jgi:hypothetical protein